jgi:hypothetical protein
MPRESWQMSRGLRAVTAAYGLIYLGLVYVVMRFFFPRVVLLPVTVMAAVLYVAVCLARFQAVIDRVDGEVAIIVGWWTRHVPLTQIEQVKVVRSGVQIRIAGGLSYGIGPLWKRRWLRWLPPVRSGFEEMDLAITQATAAARAADPDRAAAEDAASRRAAARRTVLAASFASGVGLVSLAAAAVVQPQAHGRLVHVVAVLLRIYFGTGGAVAVLVGAGLLVSTWRNRHTVRRNTETVLLSARTPSVTGRRCC